MPLARLPTCLSRDCTQFQFDDPATLLRVHCNCPQQQQLKQHQQQQQQQLDARLELRLSQRAALATSFALFCSAFHLFSFSTFFFFYFFFVSVILMSLGWLLAWQFLLLLLVFWCIVLATCAEVNWLTLCHLSFHFFLFFFFCKLCVLLVGCQRISGISRHCPMSWVK